MPRWDRRLRMVPDWTVALFFRPDNTKVDLAVERDQARRNCAAGVGSGARGRVIPAAAIMAPRGNDLIGGENMTEHAQVTRADAATGRRTEVAVLAGGCFWGVEEILRAVPGVLDTDVGYTGGWLENPTYHDTHDSRSGHAEAVRITFDPAVLSYEELLEQWFFRLHDPTTLNRQGNDVGTQYRSAIFPQSEEQRATAERVIARVGASGKWGRPVTTTIEPAGTWYSAEGYHQDYLRKNPGGYTCHWLRD